MPALLCDLLPSLGLAHCTIQAQVFCWHPMINDDSCAITALAITISSCQLICWTKPIQKKMKCTRSKNVLWSFCCQAGIKSANSRLNQAFQVVLKFNDSPSVCIKMIRGCNVMRPYLQRGARSGRCSYYSCRNLGERSPAGYIDLFRSSAERKTGFLMNNT